jgi:hypothetical protein
LIDVDLKAEATTAVPDPDSVEVAAGFAHENLEGWIPELATEAEIYSAFDKALDYRGDIVITRKDGSRVEGYIFDRKPGKSLADSLVRLYPVNSNEKLSIAYAEIARLEFGKDRAAGKHWEHWVAQYEAKKAAGEKNIGLQPDALD